MLNSMTYSMTVYKCFTGISICIQSEVHRWKTKSECTEIELRTGKAKIQQQTAEIQEKDVSYGKYRERFMCLCMSIYSVIE